MIPNSEIKIIASDITNLTDARYFSAKGVDYLLYDMDKISIQEVAEIKEWVEGPLTLLLFSRQSIQSLEEAVLKIGPKGIGTSKREYLKSLDHLDGFYDLFYLGLDAEGQYLYLDDEIYRFSHEGLRIVLSGGEEIAPGVKSFEELDDFFDSLG